MVRLHMCADAHVRARLCMCVLSRVCASRVVLSCRYMCVCLPVYLCVHVCGAVHTSPLVSVGSSEACLPSLAAPSLLRLALFLPQDSGCGDGARPAQGAAWGPPRGSLAAARAARVRIFPQCARSRSGFWCQVAFNALQIWARDPASSDQEGAES